MLHKLLMFANRRPVTPYVFIVTGCIARSSPHLWPAWVPDTMSTSKLNLPHMWTVFAVAEYCGATYKAPAGTVREGW